MLLRENLPTAICVFESINLPPDSRVSSHLLQHMKEQELATNEVKMSLDMFYVPPDTYRINLLFIILRCASATLVSHLLYVSLSFSFYTKLCR